MSYTYLCCKVIQSYHDLRFWRQLRLWLQRRRRGRCSLWCCRCCSGTCGTVWRRIWRWWSRLWSSRRWGWRRLLESAWRRRSSSGRQWRCRWCSARHCGTTSCAVSLYKLCYCTKSNTITEKKKRGSREDIQVEMIRRVMLSSSIWLHASVRCSS